MDIPRLSQLRFLNSFSLVLAIVGGWLIGFLRMEINGRSNVLSLRAMRVGVVTRLYPINPFPGPNDFNGLDLLRIVVIGIGDFNRGGGEGRWFFT